MEINTANIPLMNKKLIWENGITSAYYDLSINIPDINHFHGKLLHVSTDDLEVSSLSSQPIQYVCSDNQVKQEQDSFLLALPIFNPIEYLQQNKRFEILPGGFLLQHGMTPYTLNNPSVNQMWVIKIEGSKLRQLCYQPEKLCMHVDTGNHANTAFLMDYIPLAFQKLNANKVHATHSKLMTKHILELLSLLLNESQQVTQSREEVVITAHLHRIQQYISNNLPNTELNATNVAAACKISTRYLYVIFKHQQLSFNQYLKEQRLSKAYALLAGNQYPFSIDYLASQCGFNSSSYFISQFKQRYQTHPKDLLHLS